MTNILDDNFEGWKPSKLMLINKPYSKYPPISYSKGKAKKWTIAQHEDDFLTEYLYKHQDKYELGFNLAAIPVIEKYWILDLDSDKVANEIKEPQMIEDYKLLEKMALQHGHHIVKTPHGYHIYLPPVPNIIVKTSHLVCVDIQYKDVYCLAPRSKLENGEYTIMKWNKKSPRKCGKVHPDLATALSRYLEYEKEKKTAIVETITDNILKQDVVSVDSEAEADDLLPMPMTEGIGEISDIIIHLGKNPTDPDEHYKILRPLTATYNLWLNWATMLKSSEALCFGSNAYECFVYLSHCNNKYWEPMGDVTEEAACKKMWDSIVVTTDEEKQSMYKNTIKKQLLKLDKWYLYSINCMNIYQHDNMVAEMIGNWTKTVIRGVHDGSSSEYYKINQKSVLWEQQQGSDKLIVTKVVKVFTRLRKALTNGNFPLILKPDLSKIDCDKPHPSPEFLYCEQYNTHQEMLDGAMLYEDLLKFQQFKIKSLLWNPSRDLQKKCIYGNVFTYLRPLICDNDFSKKADKITHLYPLKDAYCIDLKTSTLIKRTPEHYFTCSGPCTSREYIDAKNSNCTWFQNNYMMVLCNNNLDNVKYAQKILGSGLCGDQTSHIFTMLIGGGRNGKTFLLRLMEELLTTKYYHTLPVDFWCKAPLKQTANSATPNEADCVGKRMICQDEITPNSLIDTTKMRQHTGASNITCRQLHCGNITFTPSYTAILCSNDLPNIDIINHAVTERVRVWDFKKTFYEAGNKGFEPNNPDHVIGDPNINKLVMDKYLGSAFHWLVEGCRRYYSEGMAEVPEEWEQSANEYVNSKHILSRFLGECYDKVEGAEVFHDDIFGIYKNWVTDPRYEARGIHELKKGSDYHLGKTQIIEKLKSLKYKVVTGQLNDRRVKIIQGLKKKSQCELMDE